MVQVGDLLGGVDDQQVVAMVEPHIVAGRWVQLLGNWDSRALGGCWFMSPKRGEPDADAEVRIALWHSAGFATHAAAVTTARREHGRGDPRRRDRAVLAAGPRRHA